jgi:hypothetical protein
MENVCAKHQERLAVHMPRNRSTPRNPTEKAPAKPEQRASTKAEKKAQKQESNNIGKSRN